MRKKSGSPKKPRPFFYITDHKTILRGLLILFVLFIAYIPAMRGGFIWDDDAYITQNPTLRSVEGLWKNWTGPSVHYQYYPLVLTTFWTEYQIWGLNPLGYHILNVFIHGINALLLWALLNRLQVRGAWLASAIFALHPVHVESVAWITELKNVLSLFFYLLSAMFYFRFAGFPIKTVNEIKDKQHGRKKSILDKRNYWSYAAALLLFIAALLCKTVACSLPAAILLVMYWKKGKIQWREVLPLVPFVILGLTMGLFTMWVEKHEIKAQGTEWALTMVERILIAGRALWFYAWKLLCPDKLMFFYPRWEISTGMWWQYIYPAAALIVIFCLWELRSRFGHGPLVATLFFAGTLFPALGFFNIYPMRYSFVADHFQYHSSIGLIVLGASLLHRAKLIVERYLPYAGMVLGVILFAALGFLTFKQGYMYKDLETLWRETIKRNPSAWMAYSNLAIILEGKGQLDEALSLAQRALELQPHDPIMKHNVANMLWGNGRYDEAATLLKEVLEVRPDLAQSHSLLGMTLMTLGQYDEAEEHFRKSIQLDPNYLNSHKGLAELLFMLGKYEESLLYCRRVLEKDPSNITFWMLAGDALEALGRYEQARAAYMQVLRIQPNLQEAKKKLNALPLN
jgi:Flp pilus assembly protein TadD